MLVTVRLPFVQPLQVMGDLSSWTNNSASLYLCLGTVFCSNDAARALKNHPKVADLLSTHDHGCRLPAQQKLTRQRSYQQHPQFRGGQGKE